MIQHVRIHPTQTRPPAPTPDASSTSGTLTHDPIPTLDRRLHRSYWLLHAVRNWLWRHITPAGALTFWAMLVAGSFTDVTQSMAHQVFALLLCLLVASLLLLRKPRRGFRLDRHLPPQSTVGQPFTVHWRLHNPTRHSQARLALWEGVPDNRPSLSEFAHLAEPDESRRNWFDRRYRFYRWTWLCRRKTRAVAMPLPIPTLPPLGTVSGTLSLTPLRRGRLTLDGAEIARSDPFGFFRRLTAVQALPSSILILPRRFRLPPLPLPGHHRRLHAGGVSFAGSVGDAEEFISVRDYRPGDPPRRIHWAGWARTQKPVVKEFQEEYFVRHALLLDTRGGGPQADAFEDAVSLAASFACTVDERDSLLDLMFVGEQAYMFTGGRGLAHAEQMLEVLASVQLHPRSDPLALERLVLRHASHLSGCILILLDWDDSRRQLRQRLEALGVATLTFVIHHQPRPADDTLPASVLWLRSGQVQEDLIRAGPSR